MSAPLPALLIHGFLGASHDWQPVVEQLAPRPLWVPTLPGHGGVPPLATVSLTALADWLASGLAARGWSRVHVSGYSLGGRIALHLAERYPQRIASLTLEGAHPGLTDANERQARAASDARWAQRFRHESVNQVLADWYQQPLFADLTDNERDQLVNTRAANANGPALADVLSGCSLAHQADLRPVIASLRAPLHYVHGTRDARFTAVARTLATLQPALTVHALTAGHNVHRQQPAHVAALLNQLWSLADD